MRNLTQKELLPKQTTIDFLKRAQQGSLHDGMVFGGALYTNVIYSNKICGLEKGLGVLCTMRYSDLKQGGTRHIFRLVHESLGHKLLEAIVDDRTCCWKLLLVTQSVIDDSCFRPSDALLAKPVLCGLDQRAFGLG